MSSDQQPTSADDQSGWLNRLERIGLLAENGLLITILASMLAIAAWQIIARNVFSGGFYWADEYLRLAVLWLALIGSIAAARDHRHLRIDLLSRLLPPRITRWTDLIADCITVIVCAILAWYSLALVLESRENEELVFNALPLWWFQVILPVGFLLISYRYAIWAMKRLTNRVSSNIAESIT